MSDIFENHRDLLRVIQSDFPVTEKPFHDLAERTGMTEQQIIASIRLLMDNKIIRVFGPVFEPGKLGYTSTLVAAAVDGERVAELDAVMLDIPEITHNYLRDSEFNIWFTITAGNGEILEDIVKRITLFPGVKKIINLPVVRMYKINAVFGIDSGLPARKDSINGSFLPLSESDKKIVRALQDDFPIVEKPFSVIAEVSDADETQVIETIKRWLIDGTIRRFGARIDHRRIGYTTNILVVWSGDQIDSWGKKFAELPTVSHCYRRTPHKDWSYELYTMVHATSEDEMSGIVHSMKNIAYGAKMAELKTLYELKKTSMKYFTEEARWDSPTHE